MSRRSFLKAAGAWTIAAGVVGCSRCNAFGPKKAARPNIVFILADDLGYGDPQCYNKDSKIPTPNIDCLAGQGMRFTDAHSPTSVCTPTRYGILTGRYAWRTRLKSSVLWPWDKPLISKERLTVAEMLKGLNYNTACIGKWHLGWSWATKDDMEIPLWMNNAKRNQVGTKIDYSKAIADGPLAHGFDYYFGDDVPNFPPYCFIENDRTLGMPTAIKPNNMFGHAGAMLPDWKLENVMPTITDKAVDYIDKQVSQTPDKPFFLFFTLTAPHTPIAPTAEFQGKSQAGRYGDFVHEVDHCMGRIIQQLKKNGIEDNTLVIFTSDNGSPGRDGTNDSGPTGSVNKFGHFPSAHWRGMKSDAWEGGHRVPFIARWPGKIGAGKESDEVICLADFMATTADIVGFDLPDNAAEDSFNILPVLLGEKYDQPIRDSIIHHSGNGMFAVRKGNWKLIAGLGSGGFSSPSSIKPTADGPKGQLYNLANDLQEKENLWLKRPEKVMELSAILEQAKSQGYTRKM
ncbi:MAG: sulfatase-like hydrolase/transferase [Phycisphaerae bacterium]|nr:sulfatase-like hydrolase/transferase [Phycisphaerae bacterium]